MAANDLFPAAHDYPISRGYETPWLHVWPTVQGKRRLTAAGPPRRRFTLMFADRLTADWETIWAWYEAHRQEWFTWVDALDARNYPVRFAAAPRRRTAGHSRVDIQIELAEQVGLAPKVYPQTPLLALAVARFITVGNTKVIAYAGYGFSLTATGVADMLVDGVSVGPTAPVYGIPLGLHCLAIDGGEAPPVITAFAFVP